MNAIAKGIWPTMLTPYTERGEIDLDAVGRMVEWYADAGCSGIFAVCQSSEMFYLSLEERLKLAGAVVDAAGERMEVIASGHVADDYSEQIEELGAMAQTGVKAVVMVSNRFTGADEPDDVWIERAQSALDALPGITLGLYECPHPYKRLLSERVLEWCAASGRFAFLKDTCCDARRIRRRIQAIHRASDSAQVPPLRLFNANTMTLLESLRDGAAGFSGVMANLHPELYVWLYQNWRAKPQTAESVQALMTLLSTLEDRAYPICAKQHMSDVGIPMTLVSRCLPEGAFGYGEREMLRQAEIVEEMARRICGIVQCEKEA